MKNASKGMPKMRLDNQGKGPVNLKNPSGKMDGKGGKAEHCGIGAAKYDKSKSQVK